MPDHGGRWAAALLAATLATVLAACTAPDEPTDNAPVGPESSQDSGPSVSTTTPSPSPTPARIRPRVVGVVASGLAVPWGIDFLPDGSAIVTERDTRRVLRVIPQETGQARVRTIGEISAAAPEVEGGLLGVAVSPDFATDRTVFFYATTADDNTVFRARLDGNVLGAPTPILTGIPKGVIHDGGRLAFGPNGFLYVSTGEAGIRELAQDPNSLAGKILRITPEGEPAPGNPVPGSPVWSLGHRNVEGLAFDDAGRLWASEFGDQTTDELNRITKGANYGWPEVEGTGGEPAYSDPVRTWSTQDASPSGLAYASGNLWMAALRGEALWRIPFDQYGTRRPISLFRGEYGRIRTVVTTPDGDLWVATSNRDGRGTPTAQDDRILLVTLN